MTRSYVVTGGGRGVGRAVAERLARDGGAVVILDLDASAVAWRRDALIAARRAQGAASTRSSPAATWAMSTPAEVSTSITGPSPRERGGSPHSSWSLRCPSRWPA